MEPTENLLGLSSTQNTGNEGTFSLHLKTVEVAKELTMGESPSKKVITSKTGDFLREYKT